MVNFGFNSASILGIFLAVAGAGLYFMRSIRPELSRDHDIFFAAVGLLSGFILIFQGWRLDPILQFSQLLLAGTAVFFALETIRLRGYTTEKARRNTPMTDDDRSYSSYNKKVYKAELANIDPYDEEEEYDYTDYEYDNPRLQGTEEVDRNRRSRYEEESPRPRPRNSRKTTPRYTDEPPNRRTRSEKTSRNNYDGWDENVDHWDNETSTSRRRSSQNSRERFTDESRTASTRKPRKRRPKSAEDLLSSVGTEYVDYQPIDEPEKKPSNRDPETSTSSPKVSKPNNAPNFDY